MDEAKSRLLIERLRRAFDLFEAGVELYRTRLRRVHPEWPDAQIEQAVGAWLRERPGAEHGDSAGRPCSFPRRP
jgi:hypothetical protein